MKNMMNATASTGQDPRRTVPATAKVTLLAGSATLVLFALFKILIPDMSTNWPLHVTLIFSAWIVLYIATTYRHFGSFYLFTTAYIISLSVFHMGYIIAHAIGWQNFPPFVHGEMATWFSLAGWYCILAYGALGVGIATSFTSPIRCPSSTSNKQIYSDSTYSGIYEIGIILFLASLVALIFLTGSVGNILRFSRAEIFAGAGDTRGFGFFLAVAPSAAVLMATSANTMRRRIVAYSLAAFTFLALLFLGYRSNAMFPALIGAIIWVKLGRRIPMYVFASALVFIIIAIPTVSHLRSLGPYQDITVEDLSQSIEQADAGTVVKQLGGVATVIAYTLKWVPADDPYRFGKSYMDAIINAVPNITFSISDSGRSTVYRGGIIDEEQARSLSPGDWYTFRVSRQLFNKGGGAGFSTIAEAYLNFGLSGVIIVFVTLGLLLGRLDHADLRSSPKSFLFSGALLWPLLKTVRNHIGVFIKPASFIILTIVLWKLVSFLRSRRRQITPHEPFPSAEPTNDTKANEIASKLDILRRSDRAGILRRRKIK